MSHYPTPLTAFARHVLVLFFVGVVAVLVLDVAEETGFISKLFESAGRLLLWAIIFRLMTTSRKKPVVEPAAKVACISAMGFILLWLAWGVANDIPQCSELPLIGQESSAGDFIEKLSVCGWTFSIVALLLFLVRSLERGQAQLREAERTVIQQERLAALGEMASGIAHDLNNTLSPVVTYCELLREGDVCEADRDAAIGYILRGSLQASGVVKQLQLLYRNPVSTSDYECIDFVEVIENAVALTKPKWHDKAVLAGAGVEIRLELPDALFLRGSKVELTQAVTNLVFNAVEAMPHGGTLTIRIENDIHRQLAKIEFADNGVGMSDDVKSRCFEPFFTCNTRHRGTGLGLSVCHGVIARHGGTIEVSSEVGKGTSFYVTLPLDVEANADVADQSATLDELRVLYIDDDEAVRESTRAMLKALGANVDLAADGLAGLRMLDEANYDAVLTDLGMADMSGIEVLAAIKRNAPEQPVFLVSGWCLNDVENKLGGKYRPDRILQKPVTLESLRAALRGFVIHEIA